LRGLSILLWADISIRNMSTSGSRKSRDGRPSKYPPEFRRDAVGLVLDEGQSIADVARSLGTISDATLGNWVRAERVERG